MMILSRFNMHIAFCMHVHRAWSSVPAMGNNVSYHRKAHITERRGGGGSSTPYLWHTIYLFHILTILKQAKYIKFIAI